MAPIFYAQFTHNLQKTHKIPAHTRREANSETRIKPGFFEFQKRPEKGVKSATNQKVGGSSPSWRATSEQSPLCSDVFFCLQHKKPPGASLPCSSFPQKVSFAPAAPLQARSPRLRCTTNFLRTGASLLKRCTQFAIIALAVVANFFARAEPFQENCGFAKQNGSS